MVLTHISLASHFWGIGKRCGPRSDAAERRGVWSGSTLFANGNFYKKYYKNEKSTPDVPYMKNGLVQLIKMGKSIRQMWVKLNPCTTIMFLNIFLIIMSIFGADALKFIVQLANQRKLQVMQYQDINIWAASRQNQQSDCAPSEDSDQHPPSQIRGFAVRSVGS